MEKITIALDGPSSSGKSTVAKKVSEALGILHLNTGNMYRTVAYFFLKNKLNYNDEKIVFSYLDKIKIDVKYHNGQQIDLLDGENVSKFLRSNEVSVVSSIVSQYKGVREMAVKIQRQVANDMSVIMDGRDIGTVVLPNAKYKFFLTASLNERAKRRYNENLQKGIITSLSQVQKELKERDERDISRKNSPLKPANDSITIDCTHLNADEVCQIILKKIKANAWNNFFYML